MNAGHRKGAVAGRCVVKGKIVETEEIPAYCAVATAGLGGLPDTLLSRSVIIKMRRRAPSEVIEPFRRRVHAREGWELRSQLEQWGRKTAGEASKNWPDMPDGIADVWEALLTVADLAGGDWPKLARVAAVALVADSKAGTPSLGVRLLAGLRTVFGDHDVMGTETILKTLCDLEESPWSEIQGKPLNARGLAQRLRQYEVHSGNVRVGDLIVKGYKRAGLFDAWMRYLPPVVADENGSLDQSPKRFPSTGVENLGPPHHESATTATPATHCTICGEPMTVVEPDKPHTPDVNHERPPRPLLHPLLHPRLLAVLPRCPAHACACEDATAWDIHPFSAGFVAVARANGWLANGLLRPKPTESTGRN